MNVVMSWSEIWLKVKRMITARLAERNRKFVPEMRCGAHRNERFVIFNEELIDGRASVTTVEENCLHVFTCYCFLGL